MSHPPDFDRLMDSVGAPDEELRAARARQGEWPRHLSGVRAALDAAGDAVLQAFAGLREVRRRVAISAAVFRALRLLPMGLEALYPLAGVLPPVNRFFLDPDACVPTRRLQQALLDVPAQDDTVGSCTSRDDARRRQRGGFWLYVPETLHARSRLAARHGAARRQRDGAAVSLELAARCAQPRRHPGRADIGRGHLGADGRRPRHAQPRAAFSSSSGRAGTSIPGAHAADRHERRRHVHVRVRARCGIAVHAPGAGVGGVSSAAAANGRSRIGCEGCRSTSRTVRSTGCSRSRLARQAHTGARERRAPT